MLTCWCQTQQTKYKQGLNEAAGQLHSLFISLGKWLRLQTTRVGGLAQKLCLLNKFMVPFTVTNAYFVVVSFFLWLGARPYLES